MSYELSFSPEFFYSEHDDHYDERPLTERPKPTTVYQAIMYFAGDKERWDEMCAECFPKVPAHMVDADMVMRRIEETNSCSDLRSPVSVWIDSAGWYTVQVW